MANKTAVLYQHVKINKKWTFIKVTNSRRQKLAVGSYYLSWYQGDKKRLEPVGDDPIRAQRELEKKQAELLYVAAGGQLKPEASSTDSGRVELKKAIKNFIEDCRDRQGRSGYGMSPRTVEAYEYRLAFVQEFRPNACLDEVDQEFVREFRRFLLQHDAELSDRSCYNIVQAFSTFLSTRDIYVARKVLKQMSFPPKPVVPYTKSDLDSFFSVCNRKEELIFKFFLHSMARKNEVAFLEKRDLLFDCNVVHISPKPHRNFRLKGKRSGQAKNGRRVPMPTVFMRKLQEYCEHLGPRDLAFPNGEGGVERHHLRDCKKIAKRAGLSNWEEFDLHRWRKTGATRRHEDGVSVRKIQSYLGHESLDVTLAYLGVEDAADEASQEQVNRGSLATYV